MRPVQYNCDSQTCWHFQVGFVAPAGSDFTLQNVGNDSLDSDADPTTGRSQVVTLVSEENNLSIDAGLIDETVVAPVLGSIGNFVFEDLNNNGIFDGGDVGEQGVTVELLDTNGDPVLDGAGNPITTVTDSGGFYEFSDLPAGDYRIRSSLSGGHFFVNQNVGGDDTIDSGGNAGRSSVRSTMRRCGRNCPR